MSLFARTRPSNTIKIAMWSLVAIGMIASAITLIVAVGSYFNVDPELLRAAVEGLTNLGASAATLGGAATLAKGGRDAVKDYAAAKSGIVPVEEP